MSRARIHIPHDKLAAFCGRWKITELDLFGSVLREDFGPRSDVDVLVTFSEDGRWSILDQVRMQEELGQIFKRPVDLAERRAVESSENYIRRHHILSTAERIYVEG